MRYLHNEFLNVLYMLGSEYLKRGWEMVVSVDRKLSFTLDQ